ncbi:hypothetical protein NEOLEDRAFT_1120771 [Neolentinus lepideus HHB14362 ss-1]|uniref:Defect at low temperature protein 1 n=1 Tax=Neolentinus lepideus HHB14362 ss-1 TaxID=1314782 RepID=A0A165PXW0_9AGAM|nr:hypothetical protein NEOLEDRAFT_1120771 [Neolentinus lepideus HHB14362 ss-1]
MSSRGTVAEGCFLLLVLVIACALGLSAVLLLSQAVRTAHNHSYAENYNLIVIGASYVGVLVASLAFCLKRRLAVRRKLQRISKAYRTLQRGDLRKPVHDYILQEYTRTCLIAFESQPRDGVQEGWGRPGSKHAGIQFRRALLDTIPEIDTLAHLVLPRHPPLRPHDRMLHHFRFVIPLLPKDDDGLTPMHYYDSVIQLARNSCKEPTEGEYEMGWKAAGEIKRILYECRLEMLEGPSSTDLTESTSRD